MVNLVVFAVTGAEHARRAVAEGFRQGIVACAEQAVQCVPIEATAFAQQLARRDVGEDYVLLRVEQQHGHRRVLHHGVEQQLALDQLQLLLAQGFADRVVAGDEVAELVVARPPQAEAVVAVAVAERGAGEGPDQRAHRRQPGAEQPKQHEAALDHGDGAGQQGVAEPRLQRQCQRDAAREHGQHAKRELARERAPPARHDGAASDAGEPLTTPTRGRCRAARAADTAPGARDLARPPLARARRDAASARLRCWRDPVRRHPSGRRCHERLCRW